GVATSAAARRDHSRTRGHGRRRVHQPAARGARGGGGTAMGGGGAADGRGRRRPLGAGGVQRVVAMTVGRTAVTSTGALKLPFPNWRSSPSPENSVALPWNVPFRTCDEASVTITSPPVAMKIRVPASGD